MLKKILCVALPCCMVAVVSANDVKTSSLAIAKTQSSVGQFPSQCQQMFQKADRLIANAEKQPGTHTQINKMKAKLSSTKQQILKLDTDMQQKSCDKGLVALNNLEKKY
ncbi:ABC transporter ATPase [Pasteurellaceae bacterium 15-036681]|nr:ABC transporter ATPase [Pasteurellaceae bacterium 15-036681]